MNMQVLDRPQTQQTAIEVAAPGAVPVPKPLFEKDDMWTISRVDEGIRKYRTDSGLWSTDMGEASVFGTRDAVKTTILPKLSPEDRQGAEPTQFKMRFFDPRTTVPLAAMPGTVDTVILAYPNGNIASQETRIVVNVIGQGLRLSQSWHRAAEATTSVFNDAQTNLARVVPAPNAKAWRPSHYSLKEATRVTQIVPSPIG